ncbi:MAG: hypothetical protein R3C12_21985 [Planctomycetaceae bacterium]|nr:hypothetical protein [Planctomycetaceae bacterium]
MSTILLEKPPETPHKPASTPKAAIARTPGRSSEWLVVLTVLGMFVLLELGFRFAGQKLSKDIAHLRSFPEIAAELAEMPASNGTRVLFLGNSLTRYGVDPNTFRDVLQQKYGQVVQGIKLNPDNTALADWFYAYRTYFSRRGIKPDVLIIGFEGGHLRDAASHHPDRLAQYYCTLQDCPELARYDLQGFEASSGFALSYLSSAFGNRDRIQRRVLDQMIPDYRAGMDELNRRMNSQAGVGITTEPDYSRLLELIAQAERDGVQVILAAMPVPTPYEFDAGLLEVVHSTSARLVDCRQVPGISLAMFFDGLHMDEQAQQLYSQALAERCGPVLREVADQKRQSEAKLTSR